MRDIGDKDNPYAGQYAEWDYWAYANGRDLAAADWQEMEGGTGTSNRELVSVGVDKDGFPVPLLKQEEEQYALMANPKGGQARTCVLSFTAYAEMPPELHERYEAMRYGLRAQHLPPIPRWLAQKPPMWALILPSGEVITSGEPGAGNVDESRSRDWYASAQMQGYSRYSAQGELLGKLEPGHDWYEFYFANCKDVLAEYEKRGAYCWQQSGYVVVQDNNDYRTLAVFDYDGTPLPSETEVWGRDMNLWGGLYGPEIMPLYKAQQEQK